VGDKCYIKHYKIKTLKLNLIYSTIHICSLCGSILEQALGWGLCVTTPQMSFYDQLQIREIGKTIHMKIIVLSQSHMIKIRAELHVSFKCKTKNIMNSFFGI
jgi:hypothetical protein